eukprot:COSAG01_NODE_3870_length_5605_cov_4.345260_8_plen_265_part_00
MNCSCHTVCLTCTLIVVARTFGNEIGTIDLSARYVANATVNHVHESMSSDWEKDELITGQWLHDCPQDLITHAVGEALGLSKLQKLIDTAEAAGDGWALGRYTMLAGQVAKVNGDKSGALDFLRKGLDACEKLPAQDMPADQVQAKELLELVTLGTLCGSNDPQDFSRLPRMMHLIKEEHLAGCDDLLMARTRRSYRHNSSKCGVAGTQFHFFCASALSLCSVGLPICLRLRATSSKLSQLSQMAPARTKTRGCNSCANLCCAV